MKISILCSDIRHPVNRHLERWAVEHGADHRIEIVRKKAELGGGDILFLISCSEIVSASDRDRYAASLVLHASDLPRGRGWSPHIWEIVGGSDRIVLSLLEAEDRVDTGRIWAKRDIAVPLDALWDEINELLFAAEIELMDFAVTAFDAIEPAEQTPDIAPTYHPRRNPDDSRIDPERSIADQFNLIRICDPERFPAFFEYRGHRYRIRLDKIDGK